MKFKIIPSLLLIFYSLMNINFANANCKDLSEESEAVECYRQEKNVEKQNMLSALDTLYRELRARGNNAEEKINLYNEYQKNWVKFAKTYSDYQNTDGSANKVNRKFFNCMRSFFKARTNLIFKDIKELYDNSEAQ